MSKSGEEKVLIDWEKVRSILRHDGSRKGKDHTNWTPLEGVHFVKDGLHLENTVCWYNVGEYFN